MQVRTPVYQEMIREVITAPVSQGFPVVTGGLPADSATPGSRDIGGHPPLLPVREAPGYIGWEPVHRGFQPAAKAMPMVTDFGV